MNATKTDLDQQDRDQQDRKRPQDWPTEDQQDRKTNTKTGQNRI